MNPVVVQPTGSIEYYGGPRFCGRNGGRFVTLGLPVILLLLLVRQNLGATEQRQKQVDVLLAQPCIPGDGGDRVDALEKQLTRARDLLTKAKQKISELQGTSGALTSPATCPSPAGAAAAPSCPSTAEIVAKALDAVKAARGDAPSAVSAGAGAPLDFSASMLYDEEAHDHLAAEKLGLPDSGLAPFTKAAQRLIYEHQHPPDGCAGKKFLQSIHFSGMGSMVHVATYHLALALETGRIFVWGASHGGVYTDPDTCARGGAHAVNNFECWFRAPSSCTYADSLAPGADTLRIESEADNVIGEYKSDMVPTRLREMYDGAQPQGPTGAAQRKFWYRTQATAYLMRFNGPALAAMRALRLAKPLEVAAPSSDSGRAWGGAMARSFPLPRGSISIHVRHGDKGREMTLVDSIKYFEAAEKAVVALGPHGYVRGGFVSTEDPGVIELARALPGRTGDTGQLSGWAWTWYDVPRINTNGDEQLQALGWPRGKLTDVWWLQLFLALEADAWVGTRGSNWNRMIDELRCVWLPKCKHVYVEVGDDVSWAGYNWR